MRTLNSLFCGLYLLAFTAIEIKAEKRLKYSHSSKITVINPLCVNINNMLFNKKKLISIVVTLFSIGINRRQLDFRICFCTQSVDVSQVR